MPKLGIMSDGDTCACRSRLPGCMAAGGPVWLAARTFMAVSNGSHQGLVRTNHWRIFSHRILVSIRDMG